MLSQIFAEILGMRMRKTVHTVLRCAVIYESRRQISAWLRRWRAEAGSAVKIRRSSIRRSNFAVRCAMRALTQRVDRIARAMDALGFGHCRVCNDGDTWTAIIIQVMNGPEYRTLNSMIDDAGNCRACGRRPRRSIVAEGVSHQHIDQVIRAFSE
jgi:hypothetical protein